MNRRPFFSRLLNSVRPLSLAVLSILPGLLGIDARAEAISAQAAKQIQAIAADKGARTPAQRKINSNLISAARMYRGLPAVAGIPFVQTNVVVDAGGATVVDIKANVDDVLLERIRTLGGEVLGSWAAFHSIRARLPILSLETLAADPNVIFIAPKQEAMTNRAPVPGSARKLSGINLSEGVVTHRVDLARYTFGAAGAGVKIGVLSDGVDSLAALQASGDLPSVTVLPGQAGSGDEGSAMLEIVHDVAPGAQLYFATALLGIASFSSNILALRAAGCDVLVDDVTYLIESPFQKGQAPGVVSTYDSALITQAVDDVTASGALYFSSAANSGNKSDGTSGTWEGDYVDGGAAGGILAGLGDVHDFGGGTLFDTVTAASSFLSLTWSDPLGASTNDYDLYVLNSTGTAVVGFSNDTQDGTGDPFEGGMSAAAGTRIIIVKFGGSGRFLHLDTNRGRLSINTAGSTHGHNAPPGPNAFGVAATPSGPIAFGGPPNPVGPYPGPFNGSNTIELFSSDGPRRFFYNADSSPITPGNFSSTGGQVVQQALITAADGVSVATPGFSPFFGTSASAPHAAAIAALVKGANPSLTATEISGILTSTAIDIMTAGVDRNSGYGIADALAAVQATGATAQANLFVGTATVAEGAGNGNGVVEPGECVKLTVPLTNGSATANATAISAVLATSTPGVTIEVPLAAYADIPAGGNATNAIPFLFTLDTVVSCPLTVDFTLTVTLAGGPSPQIIPFQARVTSPPVTVTTTLDSTPPPIPAGATATATGTQTGLVFGNGVAPICGVTKPFPGLGASIGARQYDSYTFTNCTPAVRCINVTVDQGGVVLYSVAYSGSFDPANVGTNFLADAGASSPSMSYSFNVAAGATFVVVVHEVGVGGGIGQSYTLTVDGVCTLCGSYTTAYSCCPTITLPAVSLPVGTVGSAYPPTLLSPAGGVAPYAFNVSGLAPGMTATPSGTGVTIGGTPTAPFSGIVVVMATDVNGCRTNRGYALSVVCPSQPPIVITAPATVGAGSPNRIASVPLHAGSTYAWGITNGTITAGQGTNQITFTAGIAGSLSLTVTETNPDFCVGSAGNATVAVAPAGSALQFYTVPQCRVVDTRAASGFPPGYGPPSMTGGGTQRSFVFAGQCGIPADAKAVSLNATVWAPVTRGDFRIFPAGGATPSASVQNWEANILALEAAAFIPLGTGGAIVVQVDGSGTVDVLLDVNGYFQ